MSDELNWDDLYHGQHDPDPAPDDTDDDAAFLHRPCRAKFTVPIAGREVRIVLYDNDDVNLTARVEAMIMHFTHHEEESTDETIPLDIN